MPLHCNYFTVQHSPSPLMDSSRTKELGESLKLLMEAAVPPAIFFQSTYTFSLWLCLKSSLICRTAFQSWDFFTEKIKQSRISRGFISAAFLLFWLPHRFWTSMRFFQGKISCRVNSWRHYFKKEEFCTLHLTIWKDILYISVIIVQYVYFDLTLSEYFLPCFPILIELLALRVFFSKLYPYVLWLLFRAHFLLLYK